MMVARRTRTAVAPWSGRKVTQARALVATWLPTPCGQCGNPVNPSDPFVVGHKIPRWERPDLTWDINNWAPEHKACSEKSGQSEVIRKARSEALAEHGIEEPAFPHRPPPVQSPLLPIPPSEGQRTPVEPRAELLWTNLGQCAPSWLSQMRETPADASPPLYSTPPHPDTIGSYGPEAEEWAAKTLNVRLRWWQRLCLYRALEFRSDGSLCWRTVLMSCPRRAGKSVLLYVVLMYRITHGFEENTEAVLTAGKMAQAKEIQRKAWRYAEGHADLGWKVRKANDSPEAETPEGDRLLLRPAESTAGYSPSLAVADEAWSIRPTFIDDDLGPSLLERAGGGQLWLVSTAHRRATSLMRTRISDALDRDDGKTLLLLWGAPEGADIADPEVHRAASPYITADRLETLADTYQRALAGEQDPEFDDPDPLAGFSAQLLNVWRLKERRTVGDALIEPEPWADLREDRPTGVPDAAAIESWFADGVALALSWRTEDGPVLVSVEDFADLAGAAEAVRASGYRGAVQVGSSLKTDPALKGLTVKANSGRTGAAVGEFWRLLSEDVVRHDGGEHLTQQVLAVRTQPGSDGPRVVSKARSDGLKAALWAVSATRIPSKGGIRVVLPSSIAS